MGWYCFRADYGGDANYGDGSSDGGSSECFQVAKLTPTVTTVVHNAAHAVISSAPIGSTVHDSATVAGGAGTPTGNVTFTVYSGNTTCDGNGDAAGTVAIDKSPHDKVVRDGDTVTFTIKVTNTGDVDLTNVTVTDPLTPSCAKAIGALGQGASTSYTCTTTRCTPRSQTSRPPPAVTST